MSLEKDFNYAAERATQLPKRPPNDIIKLIYQLSQLP